MGLARTFELLANTENEAAGAVLVGALDSSHRDVRDLALTALLNRRCASAELHLLRRWNDLSARWKTQIAERPGWLSSAIRAAVVNRDPKLYECGCAAVVFTRDYDLIPVLVAAASDRANPYAPLAAAATLELAELLAEELVSPRDYRVRRDPQLQRNSVLPSLERSATHLDEHGRRELLEAFLLLAERDNAALKRILQSPADRSFLPLIDVVMNSSRPGVARLLLSYLDDPHAPLSAVQALGRRSDVSFLRHLTRKLGAELTATVRANLKRIETLPWVTNNLSVLDALREAEQPGAVQLAVSSSAPRNHSLEVVAYILRHGKVAGRRVAAEALAAFRGPDANDLALRLLDDDDPLVRAAAASQLRTRGVPGAIQKLLELLDSPHEVEREAARNGLAEFRYERFAASFDEMTPKARSITGPLVRRVDATASSQVRGELESTSRGRKKRALEIAVAMELTAELQDVIAALLKDEDQYLRIDAIRVLATVDTQLTRQHLRDALLDPQPLVQQAAEAELARLMRGDTVTAAAEGHDTVSAARQSGEVPDLPPPRRDSQPLATSPKAQTEAWNPAALQQAVAAAVHQEAVP
jgi:HEAT repeat protein